MESDEGESQHTADTPAFILGWHWVCLFPCTHWFLYKPCARQHDERISALSNKSEQSYPRDKAPSTPRLSLSLSLSSGDVVRLY